MKTQGGSDIVGAGLVDASGALEYALPPGFLRVTTSPALASQIIVDGVVRNSWGLDWMNLAPGTHTVSFTHVEGYTEPAPQTVNVVAGRDHDRDRRVHPAG